MVISWCTLAFLTFVAIRSALHARVGTERHGRGGMGMESYDVGLLWVGNAGNGGEGSGWVSRGSATTGWRRQGRR